MRWFRRSSAEQNAGLPTLVLGAGDAGRELVRALQAVPAYGLRPIGFLDDNIGLGRVNGLPVLGELASLPDVAQSTGAKAALVAIPSLKPGRIAELSEVAAGCGLLVRHLPTFLAAVERDIRLSDLRGVRVDELLGRAEVHVSSDEARGVIQGRRVLVTGAGGSIGSELCRQIKRFEPAALYLLDHDESNLHALHLDLAGSGLLDNDEIIIADIRDRPRLAQIFAHHQARDRVPRGGAQAPAAAGAPPVRGREDQRAGHPAPRRPRGRARYVPVHPHLDRQGGRPDIGTGRHQAAGRVGGAPGRRRTHRDGLGPLRQRARLAAVRC